ncbi:MAG: PAS domain S-box protein [Bacteroidota bacterium]
MLPKRHSSTSEDERIRALHDHNILDTPMEKEFDSISRLAGLICNAPIALITLVDEQRLFYKSIVGAAAKEVPKELAFSTYTIQGTDVLEIPNIALDERFANHPGVKGDPHVRFYAGAPLIDESGYKLGVIGVFDTVPRTLSPEQKDGLKILAKEIITHLTLRRKSAELDAKSNRFDEMINLSTVSPEIHCILDYKGKIIFINDAVTSILEYTAEEAMGLSMWGFCFKEDIGRVVRYVEDGLRKGEKQFNVDFRIISKSGIVRWLSWSMIAKKGRWYTYGRDITESKRVENELMKLSFAVSKVNNAVVINDANNHVTWVNDAFEKITGFTLDDLKGKRLGDLIRGPKTDLELLEHAREMIRQHKSFTVDLLAYRKDKKPIWLSIYNTVVLNDEGKVDIEVEVIIDITDKKKAEHELQLLSLVASKTNASVNITDEFGNTTWVNQSLEKLTGYTLGELQGYKLGNILSRGEEERNLIQSSRKLSENNLSYAIEVPAQTKDGREIWLHVSNTPIINEQGKVDRQIDLITDITQRKQIERELFESNAQALQLSEAKEMFLSVMSHEIRTPLNAVIGMTHLLLESDPKPAQVPDLNVLKFSSENLLNIINDILDFTKIETGNMHLESIPFSIKELSADVLSSLQVSAQQKGNELVLAIDERIPEHILGDKTRLYQVFMNLIGNAVKFTSNGTIQLLARLQAETENTAGIYFEVSDNGIGIPQDKLSYIFETFTQAKTDISRKYGGTGLGLAITKKLLKLYGSEIIVESEEDKGTTFSFTIDFQKIPKADQTIQALQDLESFNGKRILVVDDNEINILIAKRILSKMGFELDFASDGATAIEKVKANRYDLVFMDIRMPGIDGFEATAMIRELEGEYFKTVPIIALTASSLQDGEAKFKTSGMNGHILKPFNPNEIRNIISAQLSK